MTTYFRDFADPDGISDFTEVATVSGSDAPSWSIVNTNQLQATSASSHNECLTWTDIDGDANRANVELLFQYYNDSTSTTQRVAAVRMVTTGTRTGYAVRVRTTSIDTYRFTGSTFTAITNATVSFTSGTWCWVRFRINGTTVQARIWADGDSEPGTWNCDATDSTYSTAGAVGPLKGANTNTQLWRKFGVGTNGDTAPASAPGGTGSVTATLGAATVSATGAVSIAGAASQTLAALASSASGALALSGAASVALADAALSATGELTSTAIAGALSATMADAALSASGSVALAGALSGTLGAATLAAEGTSQDVTVGTLTATLADVSASAAGHVNIAAELGVALGDLVVGGVGTLAIAGAASAALADVSLSATGSVPLTGISGSLAATLASLSLTATGAEAAELSALAGYTITGRARMFEVDGRSRRFEVPR